MLLKPNSNFYGIITTASPTTGSGIDPDSAIVGKLYRNGVVDVAVTVTYTDEAATSGVGKLSGLIPNFYIEGDTVTLVAFATVGGNSAAWPVWHATVVGRLPGELATSVILEGLASSLVDNGVIISSVQPYYAPAKVEDVLSLLSTQMTESYPGLGSPPTIEQALSMILALLTKKSISGSTLTVQKLDGSTAATFALTQDSSPTAFKAITRTA